MKTKKMFCLMAALVLAIGLSGCGDGIKHGDGGNGTNYVVLHEAGVYRLHRIENWADTPKARAYGVKASCCGNTFCFPYESMIVYKEIPKYLDNVVICGE